MLRLLFALLSLWLCLGIVQAQTVVVQSADFKATVQIDLGYPQWLFSQNDNSSYVYKATLVAMWETENTTDYDYVANSYVVPYGFSINKGDVVNNSQQISVETAATNARFDKLALNTRVPMWAVNGSDYPAGKFDVEISNYQWVSMSDSAQLILAFVLNYEQNGAAPNAVSNLSTHGSRTVDFADAYFSINSTAMGGPALNTSIGVAIKLATDVNTTQLQVQTGGYGVPINVASVAYVIYDHFDTNLKHDPEFGFGTGPGNGYIWIIIIVVVVIAIIVIILIAVIGFILVRRRRRSYDAF